MCSTPAECSTGFCVEARCCNTALVAVECLHAGGMSDGTAATDRHRYTLNYKFHPRLVCRLEHQAPTATDTCAGWRAMSDAVFSRAAIPSVAPPRAQEPAQAPGTIDVRSDRGRARGIARNFLTPSYRRPTMQKTSRNPTDMSGERPVHEIAPAERWILRRDGYGEP